MLIALLLMIGCNNKPTNKELMQEIQGEWKMILPKSSFSENTVNVIKYAGEYDSMLIYEIQNPSNSYLDTSSTYIFETGYGFDKLYVKKFNDIGANGGGTYIIHGGPGKGNQGNGFYFNDSTFKIKNKKRTLISAYIVVIDSINDSTIMLGSDVKNNMIILKRTSEPYIHTH